MDVQVPLTSTLAFLVVSKRFRLEAVMTFVHWQPRKPLWYVRNSDISNRGHDADSANAERYPAYSQNSKGCETQENPVRQGGENVALQVS